MYSRDRYFPIIVLLSATLFFAYDIVADLLDDDESLFHILIETVVFVATSTMLFAELRRVRSLEKEVTHERDRTARLSGELVLNMQQQFASWELSPSESEIALLLIKGLSMKEISSARNVKEATIRQQAASIYSKSGCAGRNELAAYFIEDLFSNN